MLVLPGSAMGANRDREPSCAVAAASGPRSSRLRGRWRASPRPLFGRAVCYELGRTLCCEIHERTVAALSEFHGLPFHPSRLAKFAEPFWDRVQPDRPGPD